MVLPYFKCNYHPSSSIFKDLPALFVLVCLFEVDLCASDECDYSMVENRYSLQFLEPIPRTWLHLHRPGGSLTLVYTLHFHHLDMQSVHRVHALVGIQAHHLVGSLSHWRPSSDRSRRHRNSSDHWRSVQALQLLPTVLKRWVCRDYHYSYCIRVHLHLEPVYILQLCHLSSYEWKTSGHLCEAAWD